MRSATDLQERIYGAHPGTQPTLVIEHADGTTQTVLPRLIAFPPVSY
jgi:hypothetical protein